MDYELKKLAVELMTLINKEILRLHEKNEATPRGRDREVSGLRNAPEARGIRPEVNKVLWLHIVESNGAVHSTKEDFDKAICALTNKNTKYHFIVDLSHDSAFVGSSFNEVTEQSVSE